MNSDKIYFMDYIYKYIWILVLLSLISSSYLSGQANKTEEDWILILANGDVIERREAAKKLGEIGTEDCVPQLILSLDDEDYSVVKYSMESLANIGDERGIEPIITKLESGEKWIRKKGEETLIDFGEKVVPYVSTLLEADKPWLREIGINVLSGVGDTTMVNAVRFHINDPDSAVSMSAIDYAVQAGDLEAVPLMVEQMGKMDIIVSEKVKSALIRMGEEVVPYVEPYLSDDNPYLRDGSCVVLGKLGGEEEISEIIELLSDPEIFVRKRAVDVLKERVGEFESLIIDKYSSENPLVRMGICKILAESYTDTSEEILLKGLSDGDSRVREASVMSIGKRSIHKAREEVFELLDDSSSDVRCASAWALGEIGEPSDIKIMVEVFDEEPSGAVREEICYTVMKLGGDGAEEMLIKALEDEDDRVREASARAMEELALPVFVSSLKDARFDNDVEVVEAVFDALRAIGTTEALNAIH